jgi:hypothetical protein
VVEAQSKKLAQRFERTFRQLHSYTHGAYSTQTFSKEFPMKLFQKTALAAACAGALLFAGGANARDSTSLTITGKVIESCAFFGNRFTMPFGDLDPSLGVNASKTTVVSSQCTVGTTITNLTIDGVSPPSTRVNITNGANTLPVSLAWTLPTAIGGGIGAGKTVINTNVEGTILAADIGAAVPGTYSGSFQLVLTP